MNYPIVDAIASEPVAWTWIWSRLIFDDLLLQTEVAEAMSKAQAREWVQRILDQMPGFDGQEMASRWRYNQVKDDTVSAKTVEGMVLWAVIPIRRGQTPRDAAYEWLDDWAGILRKQGVQVTQAILDKG